MPRITLNKSKKIISFLWLLILLNSFLIQNNVSGVVSRSYWPTEEWQTSQPEQQNMRSEILNPVVDYIEEWNEDHQFSDVDSIIVVKNGFIVKEAYFGLYGENDIHGLWSVTKSITSILIGIAIKEGYIESVEENVLEYFSDREIANIDERKESIKLKHLLMMSTGFDYPGDDAIWTSWMSAQNQVQYILDQPMATTPGSIFNYDTGGSHLLSAILEIATNKSTLEYAKEKLFDPLGITHYTWLHDKQGIYFGGHGIYFEPRDIAKIGYLYINNGTWENGQIVSEEWVSYSTTTQWPLSDYWGYSHQWWTHPIYGAFAAAGKFGQRIIAIPKHDLVVVFTATLSDADGEPYFTILEDYILDAISTETNLLSCAIFLPIALTIPLVLILNGLNKRKKVRKK